MAVVVAMLRGINVGGNKMLKMDALKALWAGLGLADVQTYLQSGNVVFRGQYKDFAALAGSLEDAVERSVGFRPAVILRTPSELRKVIAKNPFADRPGINPSALLFVFTAEPPSRQARDKILALPWDTEELQIDGRELYIHYAGGMARPKIPLARVEKLLQCSCTGRNWNTVIKLLAMAESLEAMK